MSAGERAAIIIVLLLPPRAFCNSLVNTESRYGTNTFFLPMERSARAEMTLPRADNDLLMFAPSLRRSPVAPVEPARSEPEKERRKISISSKASKKFLVQGKRIRKDIPTII